MIVLYRGSGASDFEILDDSFDDAHWLPLRESALHLLRSRHAADAAELLESTPFGLSRGTNPFGDQFTVLHADVALADYTRLAALRDDPATRDAAKQIATVLTEILDREEYVRFVAVRLDKRAAVPLVASPVPRETPATVERALRDAENLLKTSGPASAVDRVHTALHGYLQALCDEQSISYSSDPSITELYKRLRETHPSFTATASDTLIDRIVKSLSGAIDAANTIRNRKSVAHPNASLLAEPEAILVVNAVRTILHYVDTKTK